MDPATRHATLALDARARLGEGPLWDAARGCLWWVDIVGHALHRWDPESGEDRDFPLGEMVGTVVVRKSGGVMVALESGFFAFDPDTGAREAWGNPEGDRPENRFNDGKCDPAGRFWAGTMRRDGGNQGQGALYRLDPDRTLTRCLEGVGLSNGLVWSPDARTFYYIDTPTRRIDAFDFDLASGAIGNRRTAAFLEERWGSPDGMAIDQAGRLWVACWGGWAVRCFDPATSTWGQTVAVPAAQVTACAFGGPQLRTLYITTARVGLDDDALANQPEAGGIFAIEMDVPGLGFAAFAG